MESTFRQSMNGLHTWAGVVIGALLFAIFWMGSLAVFDKEIDRWMMPSTRLAVHQPASFDAIRDAVRALAGNSPQWFMFMPSEREPAVRVGYRDATGEFKVRHLDPATTTLLPDAGTAAASRFLYPFHYMLMIRTARIGYWIVGLAGMAWLALCVSGVVIHRKIFTDFFTFRADRKARRLVLDLHNVMGVLGFPFHVVITFSGLVIMFAVYFPWGWQHGFNGDQAALYREAYGIYARPPAKKPAESAVSLDAMVEKAASLWEGDRPYFIRVGNPGDRNGYIEMRRSFERQITMSNEGLVFDAMSGEILNRYTPKPIGKVQKFISGLHFIQFSHWSLRWIYFALGLSGCVMIATGFLFWLESRRKKHEKTGLRGVRVVEGLTTGSVTGILCATGAFFVVNRLLPLGTVFAGQERAALEIWTFFLVWVAAFVHAWWRPRTAWAEQCWTIAGTAVAAVLLNWITTGDHLFRTLASRSLWPVGGMDIVLILAAMAAAVTAMRLSRKHRVVELSHA